MSAVPKTPKEHEVEPSRRLRRVRDFIIRVRRAGVPHEETVIIPAVTLVLLCAVWKREWPLWIPLAVTGVISFACGAWLALAWRGIRILSVMLVRPLCIGTLSTVLWMATHDESYSKHEIVYSVISLSISLGWMFFNGYLTAGVVRDNIFGIFYSERHKSIYFKRKERRRYIWRLVREQDDIKTAPNTDFIIAKLLQSAVLTIPGLVPIISAILWIIYYALFGLPILPSGH